MDKAQRARQLTDELNGLEVQLAVDDLRRLQEGYARLQARGKEADAACELAQYRLDEKSAELEKLQSLLEQKGLCLAGLGIASVGIGLGGKTCVQLCLRMSMISDTSTSVWLSLSGQPHIIRVRCSPHIL